MSPARPPRAPRVPAVTGLDRTLARLSRLLSRVAVAGIALVQLALAQLYATALRPLFAAALRSHAPVPYPRAALALHTALAAYLLVSTAVHYALAVVTRPGAPPRADPEAPAPAPAACGFRTASQTWRWCAVCAAPKPPRAHHDSTTGTCALQMCHYCPAVGGVVGLRNYPHFFRFLLHAWAGSLFAAASCAWLSRRLPRAAAASWKGDAVFFCVAGGAAVAVAVGVLLAFHVYLVATAQTTIEFYENWAARRAGLVSGSYPFDSGLRGNVVAAFGPPLLPTLLPWWSVLLLPDMRPPPTPAWMLHPELVPAKDDFYYMQLD